MYLMYVEESDNYRLVCNGSPYTSKDLKIICYKTLQRITAPIAIPIRIREHVTPPSSVTRPWHPISFSR